MSSKMGAQLGCLWLVHTCPLGHSKQTNGGAPPCFMLNKETKKKKKTYGMPSDGP